MTSVKIATVGGFVTVPSIASVHGVHLCLHTQFKRTYMLVEEHYGCSIATVTKRVGLTFLKGARTGRTLKRFHEAHAYSQSSSIEESRRRFADKDVYRKWRAAWLAPTRYVRLLERKCK